MPFPKTATSEDAKLAIALPARDEGIEIEEKALNLIISQTQCYPYFLQEWGSLSHNSH
jgi:hypothetical protein